MRRLVNTLFLVVISLVSTAVVAPQAQGYAQYGTETYYYNYGSSQPDGSDAYLCGNQWAYGDRTPDDGELKAVFTWKCDTGEYTVTWYRYSEVDCSGYTPGWSLTFNPAYYYSVWPC